MTRRTSGRYGGHRRYFQRHGTVRIGKHAGGRFPDGRLWKGMSRQDDGAGPRRAVRHSGHVPDRRDDGPP